VPLERVADVFVKKTGMEVGTFVFQLKGRQKMGEVRQGSFYIFIKQDLWSARRHRVEVPWIINRRKLPVEI
ncbi:hypothetical protein L6252_02260, partial [Candidatus Parcubacteria bacterium]|nr:hypothetical protein [Candidatus Parcubacteria bacterium]